MKETEPSILHRAAALAFSASLALGFSALSEGSANAETTDPVISGPGIPGFVVDAECGGLQEANNHIFISSSRPQGNEVVTYGHDDGSNEFYDDRVVSSAFAETVDIETRFEAATVRDLDTETELVEIDFTVCNNDPNGTTTTTESTTTTEPSTTPPTEPATTTLPPPTSTTPTTSTTPPPTTPTTEAPTTSSSTSTTAQISTSSSTTNTTKKVLQASTTSVVSSASAAEELPSTGAGVDKQVVLSGLLLLVGGYLRHKGNTAS